MCFSQTKNKGRTYKPKKPPSELGHGTLQQLTHIKIVQSEIVGTYFHVIVTIITSLLFLSSYELMHYFLAIMAEKNTYPVMNLKEAGHQGNIHKKMP